MHSPSDSTEALGPSQSSATSTGLSASNAEEDLTPHYKRTLAKAKAKGRPKKSLRLKAVKGSSEEPVTPHLHKYDTRNQPLTRAQKRDMSRKPKPPVKRQKSVLLPRKGTRPQSKGVRAEREARRVERDEEVNNLLDSLRLQNPLDEMSLHLKKRLAVYISLTQLYGCYGWKSRTVVEEFVADLLDLKPSSGRRWSHEYETNHFLEEDRRGKHSKVRSPVYDHLQLNDEDKYSSRTVSRWLHALGFSVHSVENTLYVDGHEREDVVADRKRLYNELEEVRPSLLTIDDSTLEQVDNEGATHVLISQDEKIHHSGDTQRRYWSDGRFTKLRQKSLGRTVMTSDFLSEIYGFVRYSEEDILVPGERTGSVLDVAADGYYNNDRCLVDFLECSEAVKTLSGGKLGYVNILFDWSLI
ncbi:hypothetical protein FOL47_007473 [Perkinsus chesapeaki]|uniref:Uncharacterized protein n=1 Tax=Perkinsus chesapeaki TaxID=330153 RepID=A0A7J6LKD4_PERCH|nr:hypothetical protein FOL47_007473 [Perkinsus chesapeaki]